MTVILHLISEDDFDERGEDSFSDAGDDNEATTPSPEMSSSSSASPPSSSSEDEGPIGTRYPQITRNKPPDVPPGTVHPDGGLKLHHQAALEVSEKALSVLEHSGVSSSGNLLQIKGYNTPSIWYDSKCAKAINNFCPVTHERVHLNALAKGMKTTDNLYADAQFYVDLTGISDKNPSRPTEAFCGKATPTINVTGHANPSANSTEQTKHAPDSMEQLLLKLGKLSDKHPNIDNNLRDDFSTAAKVLWMDTSKQSTSGQALIVKSATNLARSLGKHPKKSAHNSKHSKHRDRRKTGVNTGSNVSTGIYAPTGSQLHTLQHGADMCKLNKLNHSFGQNYDTDDTIYEYLSTYGMEPADSSSASLNGKLTPIEICLN